MLRKVVRGAVLGASWLGVTIITVPIFLFGSAWMWATKKEKDEGRS